MMSLRSSGPSFSSNQLQKLGFREAFRFTTAMGASFKEAWEEAGEVSWTAISSPVAFVVSIGAG